MADATEPTTAQQEHPDAPHIRRQVEYYFSDENLPTDLHMLQCCGGRENLPVSLSRICGFKKMRHYRPKTMVADALRKSAFLVVSDDGKLVSRKVPLQGLCALDVGFYDKDDIAYDPRARVPASHPVPLLPQKKAESAPGVKAKKVKPSGFEDSYAEPPVTPAEAQDEEILYDADKPFVERIEIAIQRFKQKRRMHENYANVFNKWMRFGGVETKQRPFGGVSKQELADMDAYQIAMAKAMHEVPWDREETDKWVVDFVGVAEGFLSSFFPAHYGFAPQQIKTGCQVLRSFYNYLLVHSVCDEYRDDVQKAIRLCDTAEAELPKIYAAGLALPGAFNVAASTIFGGSKAGTYTGNQAWAIKLKEEGVNLGEMGVMDEEARITFRTAIAIVGTDEQQAMLDTKAVKVLKDESCGLEVISITPSDQLTYKMYSLQNVVTGNKIRLDSVGKLLCRSWHMDDFNEYDLPKDQYPSGRLPKAEEGKQYEFWVEDGVLEDCFVGMKMSARILTLDSGITILDEVREAMCSFYESLPNELWMDRHPKKVVIRDKSLAEEPDEGVKAMEAGGEGSADGGEQCFDDESE